MYAILVFCVLFRNNIGCQSNQFAIVTTKQNGMKKAKYLFLIIWKKIGKTANQ